jgi:flagellar biosynthesis protein FlhG
MSDQAQGLRVLADQMRGDQTGSDSQSNTTTAYSEPVLSRPVTDPIPETLVEPLAPNIAVADGRLHGRRKHAAAVPHARILAVTSGKGGVGKSNFSTNLSIILGQLGQRVIIMDADMGLANMHLLLGASPRFSLEDVMHGKKTLAEILHPAAGNVQLIAGGSGITELANLTNETREAFLLGLRELNDACDLIIIDTGAGLANNVLAFLCAVNEVVVLTTPEPTAITDAYATIKVVSQENPGVRLMLVVNMVHSSGEGAAVAERLKATAKQFLNLDLEYIGCIPNDPAVPKSVRLRRPFVLNAPGCAAAGAINQIIGRLGYRRGTTLAQHGVDGFLNRIQRFFRIHGGF